MYYFCNALLPTLQNTHAHTRRSVDILPEMNRNRLPVTDTYELLTNELQFIFCMSLFRTLRTHRPRFSVLHVQVARLTHTQPLSHMIKHDFEGIVHPRTDLFLITNMFNAHIDCISCLFLWFTISDKEPWFVSRYSLLFLIFPLSASCNPILPGATGVCVCVCVCVCLNAVISASSGYFAIFFPHFYLFV